MSAEPLTDHIPVWTRHADGAVITQFDYPTCEGLGLLKMDFLGLRNLTIMADAVVLIKSNRGTEIACSACRSMTSPRTTCLAGVTRSASSSSTAGRCGPAAADEAGQLRGHLRGRRPVPAWSDGVNSHTQLRAAQARQQEITPIHPELEEPAARGARADLRAIVTRSRYRRPPRSWPATRLQADLLRRAMAEEEEGDPGQGSSVPSTRAARSAATPTKAIQAVWDVLVRFAGYASTRRTRPRTACLVLDGLPQGELPAEYMAALLTSVGTIRTSPRST